MRTKKLSLVVVPVLLTACSQQNVLHQDVYNQQYDCYQDWQTALCENYDASNPTSTSVHTGFYIGPQYYKNNRKVKYQGNVIRGKGRRATLPPVITTKVNRQAKSTPIRGGFGRGGGIFHSGGG